MLLWFIFSSIVLTVLIFLAWPFWQHRNQLQPKHYVLLAVLPLAFFIMSFIGYWHWGSSQQLAHAEQFKLREAQVKQELAQAGSKQALIARFKAVVEKNNDAKGWYLLGKLYWSNQELDLAVKAFAKAYQIEPNNLEYAYQFAESLFVQHNRKLDEQAQQIVHHLLQQDPDNIAAMNLLAADAYHQKHYKQALAYWQRILPRIPAESEEATAISEMIANAQGELTHRK